MAAAPLELRVLGPFEVRVGPHPVALHARKPRTLLVDLALHLGEPVSRDRLIDDLWGERPPASAGHALEVYVSQLRAELPAGLVVTRPGGYELLVEPDCVDAFRFERMLAGARAAEAGHAAQVLREALGLWHGPALDDFAYEPFAQTEIARLEELRQEAVERRIDADLALGRTGLVAELEALIAASPLRERLRAQLMLALYRSGRQSEALAAFRAARTMLDAELGLEPGSELRELEARILRQDPALMLAAPAPAAPQRKLATLLFADLVDSTALSAALDPEALRALLTRYFDAASGAIARHGGTVEKYIGDAVMAAFGAPAAHEDDALRAVRAAVEIREAVRALARELEPELGITLGVRIGLASGEVLVDDTPAGPLATGLAVSLAARLEEAAAPDGIAVDALTRRLTAAAGRYEPLRPGAPGVEAFRLVELVAAAPPFARRLDVPLVGRQAELAALRRAYRETVAARGARAVTLLGPAGIGKTRLAAELTDGLDGAAVLCGRCMPYGESAYSPLREPIGSRAGVLAALAGAPDAEAVADRLAAVLGGDEAGAATDIPWAFRRYCEARAALRPVVLVLDDLQWAQPALVELVEHLVDRSSGFPILVVGLARDDLLEERPAFLDGHGERILLEPLGGEEIDALAAHLLANGAVDPETRERLIEAAEGNPLFLEQLLAHAAETATLDPPPTLRALLAARLDRLGPGERAVLERAAVIGREFPPAAVGELLDAAAVPTLGQHLNTLERRGFLRREPAGELVRFRHGLIRDAVYRSATKQLRAGLHERLGDALGAAGADDELVGYHLEAAYRLRRETAPADRHTARLAHDAGERLGRAGLRAMKRSDVSAASDLLGRATTLLPAEDARRRELVCELGVALGTAGEAERADAALADALAAAVAAGDRTAELRARVETAARRVLTERDGAADAFLVLADDAVPVLELLGDERALGRTLMLAGWVHGGVQGRHGLWADSARRALDHYRRSGWPSSTCLCQLVSALYFGPTPVDEAIAECESLLGATDDLAGEANVRAILGGLEAMRGAFDRAAALVAEARFLFDDLGHVSGVARTCAPVSAAVHLLAGDPAAAVCDLEESCALLRGMGDRGSLSTQAAELAEALYRLGRYGAAGRWARLAESSSAGDDVDAQGAWRGIRAKLLARSGAAAAGEALAREAIVLWEGTDALNRRARARLDLAEILAPGGRVDEARAAADAAAGLFELKGNAVEAARARTIAGDAIRV